MAEADPFQALSLGIFSMPGVPGYPFVLGLQLMLNGFFGFLLVV